jgi:transcriptional regulator with XRE-family HTH domain
MTTTRPERPQLFPALLKYWRGRRGLSQLDLSLAADVSSRHISFLETGRANPSESMVLRLGSTLDLPMREQNHLLRAAGFEAVFREPALHAIDAPGIQAALDRMLAKHEPYPMVVMNRAYDVLRMNDGAMRLLPQLVADPTALVPPFNVMTGLFDPQGFRPFVRDWEHTARVLLIRAHREALRHPEDERLQRLLDDLLAFPDVPADWREPDFSMPSEATLAIRLRKDGLELAFLTTATTFSAPNNVTLEDLLIEAYYPLDDTTEAIFAGLA